jgi:hypothetical protein
MRAAGGVSRLPLAVSTLHERTKLNLDGPAVDTAGMRNRMNDNTSPTFAPNIFCRACASPLVQALDWEQEDESLWGVRLWCPDCGFEQAAVLDRAQLLYLSLAVEEGFAWMLDALSQLSAYTVDSDELDLVQRAQTDRISPAAI